MGIEYKIDVVAGVIYTVASGNIGAKEIESLRKRILSDPQFQSDLNVIADFRKATVIFSGDEARQLANWDREKKMVKRIGVVSNQGYGFFRMYQGWAEEGPDLKVVKDMDSAREWLDLPRENDP